MAGTQGVDVSSFQGLPRDWAAKAGPIDWAAVKFTELQPSGHQYVNPDAAADWQYLGSQKLGRIAYLFGHPSTDAAATVALFTRYLHQAGLTDTDGVCLDLETSDGHSPSSVASWARDVMGRLQTGFDRKPILYTFRSFAEAGNCSGLASYPLWIADPSSTAGHPHVPPPWSTWAIHQYAITGSIDRDVTAGSKAELTALVGRKQPKGDTGVKDLGGSFGGQAPTVGRWRSGHMIIAAIGDGALIHTRTWAPKTGWGAWVKTALGPAKSAPAITVWESGLKATRTAKMIYVAADGHVIEATTNDGGATWS